MFKKAKKGMITHPFETSLEKTHLLRKGMNILLKSFQKAQVDVIFRLKIAKLHHLSPDNSILKKYSGFFRLHDDIKYTNT